MNWYQKFSVLFCAGLAALSGHAQTVGKYLAPRDQLIAIRAGRLFDARSGTMLTNQVVIVRGDRIVEVGSGVAIPSGASVIDLSNATVMPGMIDAHVHINTGGATEAQRTLIALANAQIDLAAGFTTGLDMDSRGGYNTVDIRDEINSGRVQGPRLQVAGESLNPRATNYYPDIRTGRFQEGFIENKNLNGPWLARAAAPNHLLELDQDGIKVLLQKKLPFVATLDDLIALEKGDLEATGGRNSRMKLAEQAIRRAVAAGVPIVFGSGATSAAVPHGKQANQF